MKKQKYIVLPTSEAGDAFCRADKAVRDYTRKHKRPLSKAEQDELGELLRERARRISAVLGIHVSSIADND